MGVVLVLLDPADETVGAVQVFENPWAFENCVESFLGVGLDYVLIVLHQRNNLLEGGEIIENLTHWFGLGEESNQLPDDHREELIPSLRCWLHLLGPPDTGLIELVLIKMALLIIFSH